jgi:hypothetical protein
MYLTIPHTLCAQQGSDLSASDLTLESGSGPINVRRMLGLQCRVLTHGSPVSIKAAYGESVEVSTGTRMFVCVCVQENRVGGSLV